VASQPRAPITERKTRLDGSVAEFACEALAVEPGRRAVLRYLVDREWPIAGTALRVPVGTVTIGHFWSDRPYNVYHWVVDGRTLAYYCNVAADTVISADAVRYLDLAVDVLLRPSGAIEILDEEELPPDLAPAHRLVIAKALEALISSPRTLLREVESATRDALAR